MGGAPLVIALGGLLLPIALLISALLFDAVIVAWSLYQYWRDTLRPRFSAAFVTSLHRLRLGRAVAVPTPR